VIIHTLYSVEKVGKRRLRGTNNMKKETFDLFVDLYKIIETIKGDVVIVGIDPHREEVQLRDTDIKKIAKLLDVELKSELWESDDYDLRLSFIYKNIVFFAIK
jgi:DNA helicase HerA-like ATPase